MDGGRKRKYALRQRMYLPLLCCTFTLTTIVFMLQRSPWETITIEKVSISDVRREYAEKKPNVRDRPLTELQRIIRGHPNHKLFPCPGDRRHFCQNYTSDWRGVSDVGSLLRKRMHRIRQKCEKYRPYMYNSSLSKHGRASIDKHFTGKRVLTSTKLDLAFCWLPKAGSTFMQKSWTPLARASVISTLSAFHKPNEVAAVPLQDFWNQQLKLNKSVRYTAFTVSRNPWQRLVSVYREKCEKTTPSYTCKLYFGPMCNAPHIRVTFKIFIQCVIELMDVEETEYYGHIEPGYRRCGVCEYPYSYVTLLENIRNETEFIFKEAGARRPRAIMDRVRQDTIRSIEINSKRIKYTDYWKRVPPHMVDRIRFLYRYELFLYDYPETPFIVS